MMKTIKHHFYDGDGEVEACLYPNGATIHNNSVIGKGAFIGNGTVIGECDYIGNGAIVHKGAFIGEGADIGNGAVICDDVFIGKGAVICDDVFIGKGDYISEGAVIGKGYENDYSEIKNAWQKRFHYVPVIENLDAKILNYIEVGIGELNMSTWHTCETTHCRAGWAVHLAGKAGRELENKYGSAVAGGLIYRVSTGRWPNFYASNSEALNDIKKYAAGMVEV